LGGPSALLEAYAGTLCSGSWRWVRDSRSCLGSIGACKWQLCAVDLGKSRVKMKAMFLRPPPPLLLLLPLLLLPTLMRV